MALNELAWALGCPYPVDQKYLLILMGDSTDMNGDYYAPCSSLEKQANMPPERLARALEALRHAGAITLIPVPSRAEPMPRPVYAFHLRGE